jgi:hypothetical protein
LQGRSDVRITDSLFRLDDQTPLYDELRMVTPNLALGRWVTEWSDEELLRPNIEDFKRYTPIPLSVEAESLLDKISRLSGLRDPRLPKELGLSFLGVEKDEKTGRTRIGLSYLLKRLANNTSLFFLISISGKILSLSKVLFPFIRVRHRQEQGYYMTLILRKK